MEETDGIQEEVSVSEVKRKPRLLINLDHLPLTHEHILKTILLYSDAQTLRTCERVCSTWRWWISSSRIWTEMLAVVRVRARSLAWSIRFCIAGVGDGWMDDMACEFVVHRLEHLSEGAREVAKEGGRVMVRGCAIKTSRIIEDTKSIMGTANYSQLMFNLLKIEESQIKIQELRLPSELRSFLVDWMFDIGGECAFKTETVHQAVGIVDRALSHGFEEDHSPQVLAITALRVAAEFEDGDAPPSLYDMYTDATGDEFTEREISDIVDHLLRTLQFNWYFPSSHLFISKLSQMTDAKPMTIHLSHYLNDLLLVSGNPGGQCYAASLIASACLAAAQQFLGLDTWPACLVGITGYSFDQLEIIIKYVTRLHKDARDTENQAVPNKYLEPEFYCVAMLDQEQPLRSKVILEYFNAEKLQHAFSEQNRLFQGTNPA